MKYEISIDDGSGLDLQAAELLDKYGLTATFFIPVTTTFLDPSSIIRLAERHIIGAHTMTHPRDMKAISDEDLKWEVEESKKVLEKLAGKEIDYFCYPKGRFDDRVKQAVKDAGFKRARTTRLLSTDLPTDHFEIATSVHFFRNPAYSETPLMEIFTSQLNAAINKGEKGYFHLWFHSDEIERLNLWADLERALHLLSDNSKFFS